MINILLLLLVIILITQTVFFQRKNKNITDLTIRLCNIEADLSKSEKKIRNLMILKEKD